MELMSTGMRWRIRILATAIQQGRRFGKTDILVCEVLMTQWLDETRKLRLEYSVMRVLQHITPGEQMPFPSMDPN